MLVVMVVRILVYRWGFLVLVNWVILWVMDGLRIQRLIERLVRWVVAGFRLLLAGIWVKLEFRLVWIERR